MSWGRRLILWALCLLASIAAVTLDVLGIAAVALTDRRMHEQIVRDERVVTAQMERIETDVQALAQAYHFEPETVMSQLSRDTVIDYALQVMQWWVNLLQPDAVLEMPRFETGKIMDAVLQDEQFRAYHDVTARKVVARDKVAYVVGQKVTRAVFPLRQSVLELVLPHTLGVMNMTQLWQLLGLAMLGLLAMLLVLAVVMKLVSGSMWRPLLCVLLASAATETLLCGAMGLLRIPALLTELNQVLGLQAGLLLERLQTAELGRLAMLVLVSLIVYGMTRTRKGTKTA